MRILENRLGKDIPIRTQKDFPIEGVEFIDLMPSVMNKEIFEDIIDNLANKVKEQNIKIDYIISPEARGFIYGIPVAKKLKTDFIPVRKYGKIPNSMVAKSFSYNNEYRLDKLEIPIIDHTKKDFGFVGKNFYLIDDIYATGNTVNAIKNAIIELGGNFIGTGVVLNLKNLNNDEIYSIIDANEN